MYYLKITTKNGVVILDNHATPKDMLDNVLTMAKIMGHSVEFVL